MQSNFYKCKIALITIKFLLFQAISNHKAWPGQDFQCDFAPVASVIFSLHACYVELHSMQSNWLCYMKQFCVNQGTAIFMCVLNVFNFTNVILHTMYVRIKVSFLCKCKLTVNVQNIYKSPALLSIISAISSLSSSLSRKFLSDPGIPGVRSMGPSVSNKLTDLWLSYRLYTSYTSFRLYTSYRLYTEKVTVSSGAIWWPNLELMQVAPSGGQICN